MSNLLNTSNTEALPEHWQSTFDNETTATNCARYITANFGIETTIARAPFRLPNDGGDGKRRWNVEAICTEAQITKASLAAFEAEGLIERLEVDGAELSKFDKFALMQPLMPSAEQLRAQLLTLAPRVRELMREAELVEVGDNEKAVVSLSVLQFAVAALALVESQGTI